MNIKRKISLCFILVASVIVTSCNSNSNKPQSEQYQQITTKGKVIDHVICKKDLTLNYSVYIPSSYTEGVKYPIIYFFDPHAKGLMVINKYKAIAEKYGYIIAASNNNKNGLPYGQSEYIYNTISKDAFNKMAIDTQRIYTAGFSGGARVASSIAIFKGGIAGVIACGAGFPQVNEPIKYKFNFIGLVGNCDFNFIEMNNLNLALDNLPFAHQFNVFNGKHEWPDSEQMEDAFAWLTLNSMKDKIVSTDNGFIKNYVDKMNTYIKEHKKDIQINELYDLNYKMVNYLSNLTDVTNYKTTLESISNSKEYKDYIKAEEDIKEREMTKMREFSESYISKPVFWWETEINKIKSTISDNKNPLEVNLGKRLLNYISMISYVTIDRTLKTNNVSKTGDFLQIYYKADPKNPDFKYLTACYLFKMNDKNKAFEVLERAISEGFDDKDKIISDNYFSRLETDKRFNLIINKIPSK